MFDLFVARDLAQRRVKNQFEPQPKRRATVAATADEPRAARRTASAWAVRLLPLSNR